MNNMTRPLQATKSLEHGTKNPGEHGRIILKWILKIECELDSCDSRYGSGAPSREHDIEPSGFIIDGKFIARLSDYQLLNKDFVPWSLLSLL